jgi:Mycobacterium membrane protein
LSNSSQPGDQRPERDPAAPPPSAPDGTSPVPPSGDPTPFPLPAYQPPTRPFSPGQAAVPEPEYPPTAEFPATPRPPTQEPVNYAPPGYPPDYGEGYQPPQAYPPNPPPPGPAPRKSSVPIIAVIVAVSLLLCGGIVTASVLVVRNVADRAKEAADPFDNLPTEAPDLPGLPTDLPDVPGLPSNIPDLPGLPPGLPTGTGHTVKVTFEVSGDGPAEIVYLTKLGERPKVAENVSLPWRFSADVRTPVLVTVSATRTDASPGSISCRTLVDGKEVEKKTSGPGGIGVTALCTHLALN